jgi:hypothetical protein
MPSVATVRSNSANAAPSVGNVSSQTMEVATALTTSSDYSVSCSEAIDSHFHRDAGPAQPPSGLTLPTDFTDAE